VFFPFKQLAESDGWIFARGVDCGCRVIRRRHGPLIFLLVVGRLNSGRRDDGWGIGLLLAVIVLLPAGQFHG
jgi:hypothetical protein